VDPRASNNVKIIIKSSFIEIKEKYPRFFDK
jgi:hypothetical protein